MGRAARVTFALITLPSLTFALVRCVGDSPTDGGTASDASSDGSPTSLDAAADGSSTALDAQASDAADANSATVRGTVLDLTGAPAASIKVRLGSLPPVTTGADGVFTFADAPATYDLDMADGSAIIGFRGVTTRTPVLRSTGALRTAPVNYTVQNANLDSGGLEEPFLIFTSDQTGSYKTTSTGVTGTANISWFGATTASGSLTAFIAGLDGAGKTYYRGRPSTLKVTLTASTAANEVFASSDAPSSQITIQSQLTGTLAGVSSTLHDPTIAASGATYYVTSNSAALTNPLLIPTISYPGATYDVLVEATQSNPNELVYAHLSNLVANANANATFLPTPVHAMVPADGATSVTDSTTFSWNATTGTYMFNVQCPGFSATIHTAKTATTLPDGTSLGTGAYPSGETCVWTIDSHPGLASVDTLVGDAAGYQKLTQSGSRASASYTSQ